MEPKDPNSANSSGKRRTGAKVVQLPREWLGPTDELVPFGVSADDAPPSPTPPPPSSEAPRSAQSFWTEDAASLHAALEGTTSPPVEAPTSPGRPARRRRRLKTRAVAGLALGAIAVALGLMAVIGSVLGSPHRPAPARGAPSGGRPAAPTADLGRSAADWRLLARVNKVDEHIAAHTPSRAGRSRHPSRRTARGAAPASGYRSVVIYHSSASAHPVTQVAGASGSSATSAAPIQPSSTSAGQANDTSNPSPASLLGPGHCACG